jgi:hypothetical protein
LFKSAPGRGGVISKVDISRVRLQDVPVAMRILFNWAPDYSSVTIPPEMPNVPDYWKLLAAPVPGIKGMVKISDIHLRDVRAVGARTAFEVEGFKEVPLDRFTFEDVYLDALTAGYIRNATSWRFIRSKIDAVDGKRPNLDGSTMIEGI